MHSPKFSAKVKILTKSINASSLGTSWKKKVRNDLKRQIIPDPVEYLDFHINSAAKCVAIANDIQTGSYLPSHVTRITSEKSQGLCRLIVIPDPKDALVLQVLADSIWSELKSAAPSQKSYYAPKDHAFSKPRKGLYDDYGPIAQWLRFQQDILGFSKRYQYIVVTDIANYYDWIRYSGLRSVLNDHLDTKEVVLDILIFVLKAMIWRPDYMQNDDLGLPQCDFDAPRMLAHTFLFEIDGLLSDYPKVDFARYMDDIDIGVDTLAEAKRVVRDLDLTLQSRHLRLNSGKTRILTAAQAIDHFCIEENNFLDALEKKIERLKKDGLPFDRTAKIFRWLSVRWDKSGNFQKGNGSKILKRLINYSKMYHIDLDEILFEKYFLNNAGLRETLLRFISKSENPTKYIELIDRAFGTNEIVDDVTIVRVATSIVTARYTRRLPSGLIEKLIAKLDKRNAFGLLGSMLLTSRFLGYKDLRKLIDNGEYVWRTEAVVSRSVAGFLPYFRGHRDYGPVRKRLEIVGGGSAAEILLFYDEYIFGSQFSKISNFLKAPNPSYINGITHSKFMMIFGYLSNGTFSRTQKAKFLMQHTTMRRDVYYRAQVNAKLRSVP